MMYSFRLYVVPLPRLCGSLTIDFCHCIFNNSYSNGNNIDDNNNNNNK